MVNQIEAAVAELGEPRILDVACGSGTLALRLKARLPSAHVVGLDGDSAILRSARSKARRRQAEIHWVHGLSHSLPFPDHSFDAVVSSLFFHHLSPAGKRQAATEMSRVVRPGGTLLLADFDRPRNVWMNAAFLLAQMIDGFTNTADHRAGRIPGMLSDVGWKQIEIRRDWNTWLGTLTLLAARKDSPLVDRRTLHGCGGDLADTAREPETMGDTPR